MLSFLIALASLREARADQLLTDHGSLTYYSAPSERDFGTPEDSGTDLVTYTGPDSSSHESRFVRGFTWRYSTDPQNSDLSGVAMEGSGFIDPALHRDDPYLMRMIDEGYRVLNLDEWSWITQSATFYLAREPEGAHGALRVGASAAVRVGNSLFHVGDCLAIYSSDGRSLGRFTVNDDCSSCFSDQDVDLFMPSDFNGDLDGPAKIYLCGGY